LLIVIIGKYLGLAGQREDLALKSPIVLVQ